MELTDIDALIADEILENEGREQQFRKEVLVDFYTCCVSREASILARKEVLTGKAKFGITGDGKEVAQVALAKALQKGDWRAGYYRDQTLLFRLGEVSVEAYFSQLYADADHDPFSGGRQMMTHFASRLYQNGAPTRHLDQFNSSADVSCTAGQVARAVGLGLASRKYREIPDIVNPDLTRQGNEVVLCTIGDGSTSEGAFWESVNAAAVLKIPIAFCVWDDGYAISVPKKYQTTKQSISKAMEGFLIDEEGEGIRIYVAQGWDYPSLCDMFLRGAKKIRETHVPALFHVQELTQPSGHSTSGSHERYKPEGRLDWEKEKDCIEAFAQWIIEAGLATQETLGALRQKAKRYASECKNKAWQRYNKPNLQLKRALLALIEPWTADQAKVKDLYDQLRRLMHPLKSEMLSIARQVYYELNRQEGADTGALVTWIDRVSADFRRKYQHHLYTEGTGSALDVPLVEPVLDDDCALVSGFEVLNRYFEEAFKQYPNLFAFGEDVGKLGDVNQGMMGMQAKFGEKRVFDTGIREWTIVGQAIGMAMRGLRPIAEIQYLDYLIYAMPPLVDDLATLSYRTSGIQRAPAIIRTRGHRLEGIWHTGSPMGMILHSMRGMCVLVPRNMVQAAGMYSTMLQSTDPALMIECLNAYRLKEKLPRNIGSYTVPLGVPEILHTGHDVTLVTYGACVRVGMEAVRRLETFGISVELIDVQTLIPFDRPGVILKSLQKTNRIVFMDEDVPGGATAYMMDHVVNRQKGFDYLEVPPVSITGKSHRTPYGSDGDYFAKPNPEEVFEAVYDLMHQIAPERYPIA